MNNSREILECILKLVIDKSSCNFYQMLEKLMEKLLDISF